MHLYFQQIYGSKHSFLPIILRTLYFKEKPYCPLRPLRGHLSHRERQVVCANSEQADKLKLVELTCSHSSVGFAVAIRVVFWYDKKKNTGDVCMNLVRKFLVVLLTLGILFGMSAVVLGATPSATADVTATLAYNLKDLPIGRAVQYFYICEKYVYITQRVDSTTYLSRLEIRGQDAVYLDQMVLENTGHGETLDFYSYNGKQYFYIGCKAETDTTYCWSIQIARIQYEPNATYTYTDLNRCTNLCFGSASTTRMGVTLRVAACVNGQYTVFRHQNTDGEFNYSFYDTDKLNALLDKGTQCNLNTDAARAICITSFSQSGSNRIQPNGNYQGMDLTSLNNIYLAGGAHGDTPQIARMDSKGKYHKLVNITNVGQLEIEGVSCQRGRIYFAIVPGTTEAIKKSSHKIYYIEESVFGINHTMTTSGGIAPTCTEAGLTEQVSCSTCKQPLSVREPIDPPGHSVCTEAQVEPGCTQEGKTEHSYCSLCGEIFVQSQPMAALGHELCYVSLGDLEHAVTCTRCDLSYEEAHALQDGVCICADATGETVVKEDLMIYHSLDLASDISVNYAVLAMQLEGFDMDSVVLECRVQSSQGETRFVLLPELRGYYYYFTLRGLTAVQMSDRIEAVLYGTRGIRNYRSLTDNYSVADYAYGRLNSSTAGESLRTLCAELLRYGTQAQCYKQYATDRLADEKMTEEHKSLLQNLDGVAAGDCQMELPSLRETKVRWLGKALILDSRVTVRLGVDLTAYQGELADLSMRIRYQGIDGKEKTVELRDPQPYAGLYVFDFDGLLASELRTVLMATVYEGDVACTATLLYSPDTYAKGKTGELGALCKSLLAYSDAAKAYFLQG